MTEFIPKAFVPTPFKPLSQGQYSVKIAETAEEVIAAQRLRYDVFYKGMGATPSADAKRLERDVDRYDAVCDHLLVCEHAEGEAPRIVGTYRLLRDESMQAIGHFYSESEYDIGKLKASGKRLMELGRSCTHPDVRSKVAMQLLWRGIGEYVMHYGIEVMFGCASFPGIEPDDHSQALSYLHHFHRAPEALCPRTLEQYYVPMDRMQKDDINEKKAFFSLPVLVKGYLRLGGVVGDGAFLDHDFNTTDILVVVRTDEVAGKYVSKYAPDSVQGAAE